MTVEEQDQEKTIWEKVNQSWVKYQQRTEYPRISFLITVFKNYIFVLTLLAMFGVFVSAVEILLGILPVGSIRPQIYPESMPPFHQIIITMAGVVTIICFCILLVYLVIKFLLELKGQRTA